MNRAARKERYPALVLIIALLRGVTILGGLLIGVGAVMNFASTPGTTLLALVIAAVSVLVSWAFTECIEVLIDIEANTRVVGVRDATR